MSLAEIIAEYAAAKVTKVSMRKFVKETPELGLNVTKDAFDNLQDQDPELVYHVIAAASKIAIASKKKTVALKHIEAATAAYHQFADDLSRECAVKKWTDVALIAQAKDEFGIERVSAKTCDLVRQGAVNVNKIQALWHVAINLQKSGALGVSKTLQEVHVSTAQQLLEFFMPMYIVTTDETVDAAVDNADPDADDDDAQDPADAMQED